MYAGELPAKTADAPQKTRCRVGRPYPILVGVESTARLTFRCGAAGRVWDHEAVRETRS